MWAGSILGLHDVQENNFDSSEAQDPRRRIKCGVQPCVDRPSLNRRSFTEAETAIGGEEFRPRSESDGETSSGEKARVNRTISIGRSNRHKWDRLLSRRSPSSRSRQSANQFTRKLPEVLLWATPVDQARREFKLPFSCAWSEKI